MTVPDVAAGRKPVQLSGNSGGQPPQNENTKYLESVLGKNNPYAAILQKLIEDIKKLPQPKQAGIPSLGLPKPVQTDQLDTKPKIPTSKPNTKPKADPNSSTTASQPKPNSSSATANNGSGSSGPQLRGGAIGSPVNLDLDGNNQIDMTSKQDGVDFDLDGDGKKERVAWTQRGSKDAWLALDSNDNGQIDSGKELFGNQEGDANGYEKMKKLDTNQDGKIDEKDPAFKRLKMWHDDNHDGITNVGELHSLDQDGVKSLNTQYRNSKEKDKHGNELRQQSDQGFERIDGRTGKSIDVWMDKT